MKHAILKRLKRTNHLPMLFIGSGMSIRYLGLENWEGLLSEHIIRVGASLLRHH